MPTDVLCHSSSNVINYLKCVLTFGVVLVHARYEPDLSIVGIDASYFSWNYFNDIFIVNFLDKTCVPIFFIISGYLYFLGLPENFSFKPHLQKWRRRISSILIPYLICNGLLLLCKIIASIKVGDTISIEKCLLAFWSYPGYGMPIMVPTWYLRDLMVMCVLAPLIQLLFRYIKWIPIIALLVFWFSNTWIDVPGLGIRSCLFYSIGAYMATKKVDIISVFKPSKIWWIWVTLFVVVYTLFNIAQPPYLLNLAILCSFPMWISLAYGINSVIKKECPKYLATGFFFVFLYHFSIAHRLPVYLTGMFGVSELSIHGCYWLGAIITTISMLGTYFLLSKFSPKICSIIVGGR